MRKNKYIPYFFIIAFIVLIIPGNLHASADLLEEVSLVLYLKVLPLYVKYLPFASIIIAAVIKSWYLKRKLSLPWELKSIEKLGVTALAETIVEFIFFGLIFLFFTPTIISLLKDITPLGPEITSKMVLFRLIIMWLIVIPYQLVIGTLLSMVLIRLLVSMKKEEHRRCLKYAVFSGATYPALIVISLLIPFIPLFISP